MLFTCKWGKALQYSLFIFYFGSPIPKSQSIRLNGNERIGATLESSVSVICFEYANRADTIFRNILKDHATLERTFSEVGNSYNFEAISLPAQWSIWVTIEQGKLFYIDVLRVNCMTCEFCGIQIAYWYIMHISAFIAHICQPYKDFLVVIASFTCSWNVCKKNRKDGSKTKNPQQLCKCKQLQGWVSSEL